MVAGSSSDPKQGSLSFFKIVRYPSAPHLSLPTAFVRRYLERIPKNPTLKTATGEHSWRLKIEKIGGDYCFGHGWEKLVKDTQLRIKDVLVFCLIDPFTFQVSFFDADGCEKDLPLINTRDGAGDGDDDDDGDENLAFQRLISEKTNKYTMTLPKKFVEAAGLENKTGIKMKDHEGKEWVMGLLAERYVSTKYSLSSGWSIFRQYHKLADGDICTFKFSKKEGVLILAQMLKNKRAMKQERNVDDGVKRKRPGRPPIEKHGGGGGGGGGVDVKIEDKEAEVVKKKRPLHVKPGGSVNVKLEDESGLEAAERGGRPPLGGGVNVKLEDESGPEEAERGRPPLGGGVNVEIEDEPMVIVNRKRGRPPLKKPGGVNIKIEAEVVMRPPVEKSGGGGGGVEVKRKRGRPRLDDLVRREDRVIYF